MLRLTAVFARRRLIQPMVRWYCDPTTPVVQSVNGSVYTENLKSRSKLMGEFRKFLGAARRGHLPSSAYGFLKACGSGLIFESPKSRVETAEHMWTQMTEKGLPVDSGLYNTLLQVYLLNEHVFSPSAILEEMKENDVEPNQGTLSLLLQAYCKQGNIAGATQMLEYMKSLDMPINEHVYAALVTGHSRSGDMAAAEKLLTVMRENGLAPGIITYTSLLCAHAEKGDMDAIHRMVANMRDDRVFPSVTVYNKIIDSLSRSGHGQLIKEVLEMVRNKQWMQGDLRDLSCQFAARGEFESALELIRCLADMRALGMTFGPVLVRPMLAHGKTREEILQVASELCALGCGDRGYEELLYGLFKQENTSDAIAVLREMHQLGLPIQNHYMYPILAQLSKRKDTAGITECLQSLEELGLKVDDTMFYYWRNTVGSEKILEALKATGTVDILVNQAIKYQCKNGDFEDIPSLISSVSTDKLAMGFILRSINFNLGRRRISTVDSLVRVYASLHSLDPPPNLTTSVEMATASLEDHLMKEFIEKLQIHGVPVSGRAYNHLLSAYSNRDSNEEFFRIVSRMKDSGVTLTPRHHRAILKMSATSGDSDRASSSFEVLEQHYIDNLHPEAYSHYIIAHAKAGKLTAATEKMAEMQRKGLRPFHDAFFELIKARLKFGHIDRAVALRDEMHSSGYFSRHGLSTLFLEAYAKRGDVTSASEEFRLMLSKDIHPRGINYTHLMAAFSFHGSPQPIRDLLKDVKEQGIPLHRSMVSELTKAYLNSGQVDEALLVLSEFPDHPPQLSSLVSLLDAVVGRGGGPEDEEKAISVMRNLGMEPMSIENIRFVSYLKAGQLDQARDVINREGFVLNIRTFNSFAWLESKGGHVRPGIELLRAKGVDAITDDVSIALVKAYGYIGDPVGALELQQELTGRGKKLPKEFYHSLALALGKEPPFITAKDGAVAIAS